MHTFFINTASTLFDSENVKHYLFARLEKSNKLIYLNAESDELYACALHIYDLIMKDVDIRNDALNFIIYVNVENNDKTALIYEKVLLMFINENFARILSEHGITAENIQVIFGEHFKRVNSFMESVGKSEALLNKQLWDIFGLPDVGKVQKTIDNKSMQEFDGLMNTNADDLLLNKESIFTKEVITHFTDALRIKIQSNHAVDVQNEFYDAFTAISNIRKKRFVSSGLCDIPLYACSENATLYERNRSAYQVYFYVYYCAAHGQIYASLPEINLKLFANLIAARRMSFNMEYANIRSINGKNKFQFLNINTLGGADVNTRMETDIYGINYDVPELTVNIDLEIHQVTNKLRAENNRFFKDIIKKNDDNNQLCDRFISAVTEDFNEGITESVKGKHNEYRISANNSNSINQTKKDAEEWKQATEGYIAKQSNSTNTDINFRNLINEAKSRTDYLFNCIAKSKAAAIAFALIMLLIVTPYIFIQYRDIFSVYGIITFLISLVIITVVFFISYRLFIRSYKKKIITTLKTLRNDFNTAQTDKKSNMQKYKSKLTHYIPRSMILQKYYEDLCKYESDTEKLEYFKNYHLAQLMKFKNYTNNLLRLLDIENLTQNNESTIDGAYKHILNDDTVRRNINDNSSLYYILNDININDILNKGGDRR